jgi:5-methylcytosine-specific restriction endonuclease McrA
MQIKSHVDRHDLKPGEYILETLERIPVIGRGISPQLRMEILERNGFTCQLCGAGAGDPDPFNPNRKLRLHIDHIVPVSQGGTEGKDNFKDALFSVQSRQVKYSDTHRNSPQYYGKNKKSAPCCSRRGLRKTKATLHNQEKSLRQNLA